MIVNPVALFSNPSRERHCGIYSGFRNHSSLIQGPGISTFRSQAQMILDHYIQDHLMGVEWTTPHYLSDLH